MPLFTEETMVDAKAFVVKKCKATIQRTGKLGFSAVAADRMHLETSSCILVSDCGDGNLAIVVWPDASDRRGFSLHRATGYYTADMKGFFDSKGIDYKQTEFTIIYDIIATDEQYQGHTVFKLTKRVKKRRAKDDDMADEERGDIDTGEQ